MDKVVLLEPWTLYFQRCEIAQLTLLALMTIIFLYVLAKKVKSYYLKRDVLVEDRDVFSLPLKLGLLAFLIGISKTFYLIESEVSFIVFERKLDYEYRALLVILDSLLPLRMGILILLVGFVETLLLEYGIKKKVK